MAKKFMPDGLYDVIEGKDPGDMSELVKKYDGSDVVHAYKQDNNDADKGWAVHQSWKPFRMPDPQNPVVLDGSDGTPEWQSAYGKKPAFSKK